MQWKLGQAWELNHNGEASLRPGNAIGVQLRRRGLTEKGAKYRRGLNEAGGLDKNQKRRAYQDRSA